MDKTTLLALVLQRLEAELALRRQAADQARREATDDQLKSENKYDTRGTEASYLARGHALSTEELENDLAALRAFTPPAPVENPPVAAGMLAEVVTGRASDWYLLLPCAGGTEVELDGHRVTVLTPTSPMGQKLLGRRAGNLIPLRAGLAPALIARVC